MWTYVYSDELYHSYDELWHYGVPGMKWGKRKARPFATGTSSSGTQQQAKSQEQVKAERKAKAKKAAIAGAAVAGTALAAYGAYKLVKCKQQSTAGKQAVAKLLADADFERRTGLRPGEVVREKYDSSGKLVSSITNVTTPRNGETIREVWDAAGNVIDRRRY